MSILVLGRCRVIGARATFLGWCCCRVEVEQIDVKDAWPSILVLLDHCCCIDIQCGLTGSTSHTIDQPANRVLDGRTAITSHREESCPMLMKVSHISQHQMVLVSQHSVSFGLTALEVGDVKPRRCLAHDPQQVAPNTIAIFMLAAPDESVHELLALGQAGQARSVGRCLSHLALVLARVQHLAKAHVGAIVGLLEEPVEELPCSLKIHPRQGATSANGLDATRHRGRSGSPRQNSYGRVRGMLGAWCF